MDTQPTEYTIETQVKLFHSTLDFMIQICKNTAESKNDNDTRKITEKIAFISNELTDPRNPRSIMILNNIMIDVVGELGDIAETFEDQIRGQKILDMIRSLMIVVIDIQSKDPNIGMIVKMSGMDDNK